MERYSSDAFLKTVKSAARKKFLFLPHAVKQMSRPDRMISTGEVKRVVREGEIIENYPDDIRGHSCLMLGNGYKQRAIHVVCSPKEEYLAIITAYLPSVHEWKNKFKERK